MARLLASLLLLSLAAGLCRPAAALDLQRLRMLTAAEQAPWRGVGRLDVHTRFGDSMCTATLIAEDLVLTAAHCVVNPVTGLAVAAEEVEFSAGMRLGVSYGRSLGERIAVHPRYDAGRSSVGANVPYDLALVRLQRPIPQGRAPFFAIAPTPVTAVPLTLISYRQDRDSGPTRQDGCTITEIGIADSDLGAAGGAGTAHAGLDGARGAVLTLGCEVIFGASGSALFEEVDGTPRVVAVLSAMNVQPGKAIAYAVSVSAAIDELRAALK